MRSRSSRRVHLACAGVAIGIVPMFFAQSAQGADRSFIDPGGGNFQTAGNWSPASVPGISDAAHFTLNGSYTVSFSASPINQRMRLNVDTVTFNLNNRTYTLTEGGVATNPSIGIGQNSSFLPRNSQLILTNGTLSAVNAVLGSGTVGMFSFANAGRISANAGARLNLSGSLFAGFDTAGNIDVAEGADVSVNGAWAGYNAGAFGGITASGAGSTFATTFINVGSSGNGTLTISADADMTSSMFAYLGRFTGSTGAATISGAGSTWNNTGTLMAVGGAGAGTLMVSGGGSVSSPNPILGDGTGSSGVATVTGGSSRWGATGSTARIGNFGNGSLTISNGGTAGFGGTTNLADRAGSTGALSVTGNGSLWLGFSVVVGNGGIGTMSVTDGGVVDTLGAGAVVGNGGTGRGTVLIDGAGSQWEIGDAGPDGGLGLSVGVSGLGSVTIQNGGALFTPAVKIASEINSAGSGTILVTGANSSLNSTGAIAMTQGIGTAARLGIDAGGTVNAGELLIGPRATVLITSGHLVSGPMVHNGTFTQTGGTASVGPVSGTSTITLAGAASFTADHLRIHTLNVSGNSTARVRPSGGADAGTSVLKNLAIGGSPGAWQGKLDLSDNDLVIDYDVVSPLLNVVDQIRQAYNGGAWNGTGGITSAHANANQFALGYAESSAIFTSFPATFSGQSVDDTAVLVKFTRYGDANLDGVVNLADFNALAANFGQTSRFWRHGDFNYDGIVNLADFNRLAANFGLSAGPDGPTAEDWSNLAAAVPEPALPGMTCIAAWAALYLRPRRRRRL